MSAYYFKQRQKIMQDYRGLFQKREVLQANQLPSDSQSWRVSSSWEQSLHCWPLSQAEVPHLLVWKPVPGSMEGRLEPQGCLFDSNWLRLFMIRRFRLEQGHLGSVSQRTVMGTETLLEHTLMVTGLEGIVGISSWPFISGFRGPTCGPPWQAGHTHLPLPVYLSASFTLAPWFSILAAHTSYLESWGKPLMLRLCPYPIKAKPPDRAHIPGCFNSSLRDSTSWLWFGTTSLNKELFEQGTWPLIHHWH